MARVKRSFPTWAVLALVSAILVFEYVEKGAAPDAPQSETQEPVRLHHVIDGDTLDVLTRNESRIRVRLLGIDCMETYQKDKMRRQAKRLQKTIPEIKRLGQQGKKHLEDLLRAGELRLIQPDGLPPQDPYGRTLAYLEVNGDDIALSLLKAGLAETRREPHPRSSVYQSNARQAKQARQGMYQD